MFSLSRLQRRRFAELCFIHRNVRLYVVQYNRVASVQPRVGDAEWQLDPADVAIVGEVNLRGNAADWRVAIPQLTQEQAALLVEVQRDEKAPRPRSLHDIDYVGLLRCYVLLERCLTGWRRKIGNGGRGTGSQIRENL